jgi:hypothetical protein
MQADGRPRDERCGAGEGRSDVDFAAQHNRAFRSEEIAQNAAEGGCDDAHRNGHGRACLHQQRSLSSNDGKNTKACGIEPQQKLVAGLRDVSREKHKTRDQYARDQISRRVNPEYGSRAEQNVPKCSAANSCNRSQQHESDDVHLLARGYQRARDREPNHAGPIQNRDCGLKHHHIQ